MVALKSQLKGNEDDSDNNPYKNTMTNFRC